MRIKMMLGLMGCLLVVAGCGFGPEEPEVTSTPTVLPVSTFTPTPVPVATAVEVAVAENTPETEIVSAEPDSATSDDTTSTVDSAILPTVTASASTAITSSAAATETAVLDVLPTVTPDGVDIDDTDGDDQNGDDTGNDDQDSDSDSVVNTNAVASTSAQLTIIVEVANVRAGPDISHQPIGTAQRDEVFEIVGRNETSDWWQVCCLNEQPGWLFESVVTVQNVEAVAIVDVPPPVIPTPAPVAVVDEQASEAPPAAEAAPEAVPEAAPVVTESSGTAGSFDPNSQYHIVHYRVLGFDDNNGGIFNKGGQQLIFVTVLDGGGNPMDGVVVKDAVGDKLNVVTGSKGPGRAEIKMDWDPYKLYVAQDPSGPVTSQVSNQMNNPYPHIPDVVGLLGPADNEYAICPTVDDRCSPPFYHAHWSYEITFQKVR